MPDTPVRLGIFPPGEMMAAARDQLADGLLAMEKAGLDHVCTGDHISFFVGFGVDGLVNATAYSMLSSELKVFTAVYLLPLRHPVPVARQISTLGGLAPGRLISGVGIGGEDRHEIEICGIDPATRGRRMDEYLRALRELLKGKPVDFDGEFLQLEKALIIPGLDPPPPIIVGGRSDAAIRRAGRLGDGWIAIWVLPDRWRQAIDLIDESASAVGRSLDGSEHTLQVWCAFDNDRPSARARLANAMQAIYGLPFEKFEKYSPYGSPKEVAEFLEPFVEAGCRRINLIPQAATPEIAIAAAAEVKSLINMAS